MDNYILLLYYFSNVTVVIKWLYKLVVTDRRTDRPTLLPIELLSQLKIVWYNCILILCPFRTIIKPSAPCTWLLDFVSVFLVGNPERMPTLNLTLYVCGCVWLCVCYRNLLQDYLQQIYHTSTSYLAPQISRGITLLLQGMKIYIIEPVIKPLEFTPMIGPLQSPELFSTST